MSYGSLESPGYPANIPYPPSQTCTWIIQPATGSNVKQVFEDDFVTESGEDTVEVMFILCIFF